MHGKRYGDVEVVSSPLIVNPEGKILLIKSRKWGEKFLIPGGHVEKGETVLEAAKREGEEEVGIELEPQYCVNVGELINSPLFIRPAHLVFFHVVCKSLTSNVYLDDEFSEFVWIDPADYKNFLLIDGIEQTIVNYLKGIKISLQSLKY